MRIGAFAFTPGLVPTLATLALLPLLLGLGLWQLDRGRDKDRLHARYEARRAAPAVDLGAAPADPAAMAYRGVRARGRFDARHQYLLDNRTRNGTAGYHVYTLLRPEGGGHAVLVNRGWVPVGPSRDRLPELPAPEGVRAVRGVVAPFGEPPPIYGPAGYDAQRWPRVVQRLELATIARQLGVTLLPYMLVLAEGEPGAFASDWRPYYGLSPERHRAYAFQWFMLAGTLFVIFVVVNARRVDRTDD